ncbi:DUF3857 domain-containing protein [Flavobacterium sp.]|uniref:DUF3857 domain-containing protein n=1 Tax=Flavobacterium sp. TaxID=239 RepID=UPI002FDE141F
MRKLIALNLLILSLCNINSIVAQDYTFKNYKWEQKPTAFSVPEQYKNENEIVVSRTIKVEIISDKNGPKQYYLLHDKIFINSDDAIEKNNKIYLPFNLKEDVIKNEARVILKNGKIINLDKKDIKEEVDEQRGIKFNYFAINGLEKGAIIEKIFVLEESPELNGKTLKMQDDLPIMDIYFELIYPNHLVFKTKGYNNLAEAVLDEKKYNGKIALSVKESNIPKLEDDEKYSNWKANIKYFRYKLDANLYNGSKNLYNYKEFASNIYERFNTELDKKNQKAVDDFCKTITKSADLQEQIWNIENKVKKTIAYNRYFDSKENLSDVFKTKQANQSEILALYLAIFKYFKIENQIVFASNRYNIPFDSEFESYENLDELLIFFPTIKKFMTPTEIEYRIPLIPNTLANNNGLFIKGKEFSGVKMGIGEINFIPIPGVEITHDVMNITIDFTKDIENPIITNEISFGGYSALNFQPIKDFAPADQYKEILKSIAENYTIQENYTSLITENDGTEFIGKKPFVLKVTFEGKDLVQKAGDNYLFSVGKTIGSQMELYQENKRMMPVEIDYPHSYFRKIKIILPKGLKVKNLEKFNMSHKTDINGKTEAIFVSNYKTQGDEILVENTEYYNIINYPLEHFESYKAVINAAADFNKIVIVLNK